MKSSLANLVVNVAYLLCEAFYHNNDSPRRSSLVLSAGALPIRVSPSKTPVRGDQEGDDTEP
jgi:hypothetical protein